MQAYFLMLLQVLNIDKPILASSVTYIISLYIVLLVYKCPSFCNKNIFVKLNFLPRKIPDFKLLQIFFLSISGFYTWMGGKKNGKICYILSFGPISPKMMMLHNVFWNSNNLCTLLESSKFLQFLQSYSRGLYTWAIDPKMII